MSYAQLTKAMTPSLESSTGERVYFPPRMSDAEVNAYRGTKGLAVHRFERNGKRVDCAAVGEWADRDAPFLLKIAQDLLSCL